MPFVAFWATSEQGEANRGRITPSQKISSVEVDSHVALTNRVCRTTPEAEAGAAQSGMSGRGDITGNTAVIAIGEITVRPGA